MNLYTYCHNNPILAIDPSGHFWHILAGAAVGALVSGVVQVVSNVASGNDWNDGLGTAMLTGAASGALASTGLGLGLGLGFQVAGNAALSMATNASGQLKEMSKNPNKKFSVGSLVTDGIIGGVAGLAGGKGVGGKHFDKLGAKVITRPLNAMKHGKWGKVASEASKATSYYIKNVKGGYRREFVRGLVNSTAVNLTASVGKVIHSRYRNRE